MKNSLTDRILKQAQGIAMKGHGRDFVYCIFINFGEAKKEEIADWIRFKQKERITSTYEQIKQVDNKQKQSDALICCTYFSKDGFNKLGYGHNDFTGFDEEQPRYVPPRPNTKKTLACYPEDRCFWTGMANISKISDLNDIPQKDWSPEYKTHALDALVIVACDNLDKIQEMVRKIEQELNEIGGFINHIDFGQRSYYEKKYNGKRIKIDVEPFGFRDGITTIPFFYKENKTRFKKNRPWQLVLDEHYGTYLVFRRLKQNVPLFHQAIEELKIALGCNRAFAEAQVMGRFRNGVPLSISSTPYLNQMEREKVKRFNKNSFNSDYLAEHNFIEKSIYELEDKEGLKCPFHAHIRKSNPRITTSIENSEEIKIKYDTSNIPKAIVRRSVTYDYPSSVCNDKKLPPNEGLLFMCYQKNLKRQFVDTQKYWCNDNPSFYYKKEFPVEPTGIDPIAGQASENQLLQKQKWNSVHNCGKEREKDFRFPQVVEFQGGGFFYGPPIAFFDKPLIDT
ncbi:MAG: hypothetical protein AAF960_07400 [Bacteroidota bacterium]